MYLNLESLRRFKSHLKNYMSLALFFLAICFLFGGCATHVIKIPKVLPNIVKQYKSTTVVGDRPGMYNTGLYLKKGDHFTLISKGEITYWPQKGMSTGPSGQKLRYSIGKKPPFYFYFREGVLRASDDGYIYLGFDDGGFDPKGNAIHPEYYLDNKGYFIIDIIIWKDYDPILISDFLEKALSQNPNNQSLEQLVNYLKVVKEVYLSKEQAAQEVEKANEAISALKGKEVLEKKLLVTGEEAQISEVRQKLQEEGKEAIETLKEKEIPGIQNQERERKFADLTEKLQRALQSLKDLEELRKGLAEQQQKEKELMARLQLLEEEKQKQPKSAPVIAILNPKDGVTVESECITLSGVAEHQRQITKFKILLNNTPIGLKDPRGIKITPKEQNRIEFSERICLRDGKNEINVIAEDSEGALSQKTVSVQLTKRIEDIWAVVIGIDKYMHLPTLRYAVNDAREFYRYLVEVDRVPKEKIWLLLDEEATLERIKSILGTRLRQSAGKEDTVIVYMAGHGAIEGDATSPDGDGLEKYILPYNADLRDLYSSALPMWEISRIFQRINSERLVFITDTCYSGATGGRTVRVSGVRANISGAFLERISQGRGRVVLTASDANEVSVESDELRHGVFTYYLLEGLGGEADLDRDGVITVDEVYRYVSIKVPQETGQRQHPVRKGETKGEIVLGVLR